jgi:NAD+ synthase
LAVAVIGVAGPKPDQGKPAGHVCIASRLRRELPIARELPFYGNPDAVLSATMLAAFDMGLATLAPDRNGRPDP